MAVLKETYKLCVITHKKTRSVCGYIKIRLERTIESIGVSMVSLYSLPTQIFSNVTSDINCYNCDPFDFTDTADKFDLEEIYREEITVDIPV